MTSKQSKTSEAKVVRITKIYDHVERIYLIRYVFMYLYIMMNRNRIIYDEDTAEKEILKLTNLCWY